MDILVDERTVVVFDLDDTLYNELDYLRSAYLHIARTLAPDDPQGLFVRMFSLFRSKQDVFGILSDTYGVSKSELIDRYRQHEPDIKVFDGVMEVIQNIKKKKGRVAVLTDGRTATQTNKIKALGLYEMLDKLVISEEIGTEKPSEKNYRALQEAFNLDVYYYIADNLKKDFITPKQMGWKTAAIIDNGLNIHHETYKYLDKEHIPHEFFASFSELNVL